MRPTRIAAAAHRCRPPIRRRGSSAPVTRLGELIGSHVRLDDPLAAAQVDGADAVQFFLGNPQSWKKPKPRDDAVRCGRPRCRCTFMPAT